MDSLWQEDAFFEGKPLEWALYQALRAELMRRYPGTGIRVMKTTIVFEDPRPYCYVSLRRMRGRKGESFLVTIGLHRVHESPRIAAWTEAAPGRFTHHIVLEREEEIDMELLSLIDEGRAVAKARR